MPRSSWTANKPSLTLWKEFQGDSGPSYSRLAGEGGAGPSEVLPNHPLNGEAGLNSHHFASGGDRIWSITLPTWADYQGACVQQAPHRDRQRYSRKGRHGAPL